ncbi:MAG: IS66 family transposase zinc-finger binding domain-containing protein [Paracoccaceae bacterium]
MSGGGVKLRRLGEDVTEVLEYGPGQFTVNWIVRPRFACSDCDAFRGGPGPLTS